MPALRTPRVRTRLANPSAPPVEVSTLAWYSPTTAALRPPAPPGRGVHRATDTGAISLFDGGAWRALGGDTYTRVEVDAAIAAAVAAYVLAGAGLPLTLASTLVTGAGGVDQVVALSLPVSPVDGRKYGIPRATVFVRNGSTLLATVVVEDHVLKHTASAWSEVQRGVVSVTTAAGWDTFFADADHLPGLDINGSTLGLALRPIDGEAVAVEVDALFVDMGGDA